MHDRINKGLRCCTPVWRNNHFVSCSAECPYRGEGIFCRSVLFAEVRAYIKQLEEANDHKQKRMTDWISVHDEHPPKGSRVLVLMDDHGKTSMMVADYGEGGFWLPVNVPGKLTHWIMLDEKEAGKDE